MKKVLMVLPSKDFDVTETSVPWKKLTSSGQVRVEFTTEDGAPGACDPLLLNGVIFGQLGAANEAKEFYGQMEASIEFQNPKKYTDGDWMDYHALILPGGHAQGMRQYLENQTIRDKLVPFFKDATKVVAAICHGTIVLARAIDPDTGKSLLYKRRSTGLVKYMERTAYYLTAWKLGRYYRTYNEYVEDEIKRVMEDPKSQFDAGICNTFASTNEKFASVCVDGNYVSARWPGDAYLFANTIAEKLGIGQNS